jgi:hypothetical protein
MSTVEVLAPLRLETRFVPPALRTDGVNEWMLRLRVYPDDFSTPRSVAPPTPDELNRLEEAVSRMAVVPAPSEADAFASFASVVGARRAHGLWRAHVIPGAGGGLRVDRTGETAHEPFSVHTPVGLPPTLEVWFIHAGGTRQLAATLTPDRLEIARDLDLALFNDIPAGAPGPPQTLARGELPKTWWLSYERAVTIGLGVDIDLGLVPPALDALVVLGIGDTDAADLVDAHNAGGRMAVLAPGTPTNTVAGEPTTDFGEQAESVYPLLHADAATQLSTAVVLRGLTGRIDASALPMLGGDLDYFAPGSLSVQGLWPVLWGRFLRDVTGAGATEVSLARWAMRHLAVEGPRPAFRVGAQPYGLLPTSAFAAWIDEPADPLASIESTIRTWALRWRAGAAAAARTARGQTAGTDARGLLDVLGLHAPSRRWKARAVADLYDVQALRLVLGMAPLDTHWDHDTARALRHAPSPVAPIGRAPGEAPIPGPPHDEVEDADLLQRLCTMEPEELFSGERLRLGLVGHLFREALIDARAVVGDAVARLQAGTPIALDQILPWADEAAYRNVLVKGTNLAVAQLRASGDPNARVVAERFKEVQEALQVFADLWKVMPKALFRAVLAALDTAAFRVDPWLTGMADRRLEIMTAAGAPFRLGAYGWVDAPAPFSAIAGDALAPGPTAAGLLHAPSPAQALTAALLRDAAVRYPGSDRWNLTIDSARIRASMALAERVRLGLHPYEALGLEVEKVAGDWDVVRLLRNRYPLAADQQERRVCDGEKVLRAAREGLFAADLPATLAARLQPLQDVLDTYADLLVADGVHALVTGRADLANAAMEAAAGLGAPPELRAVRTPRQASTVRVNAWVLLPSADAGGAEADPVRVADPASAAALDALVGPGAIDEADAATRAVREALFLVLGGAEDEALVPSLTGGAYEGPPDTADKDLRTAIAANLAGRLVDLASRARAAHDGLNALDPDDAGTEPAVTDVVDRWRIDLSALSSADPAADAPSTSEALTAAVAVLADRLSSTAATVTAAATFVTPPAALASAPPDQFIGALRRAIRTLVGRPDLPVLPIVARALLPRLRPKADLDVEWLEIVAAVHPRLAPLEARQLDPLQTEWRAAVAAPDGSVDPWHPAGPVVVAYGPGLDDPATTVAIAAVDGWTDSVPSRRHSTFAAFGFNAPKSRAPQAVLVAVPPDISTRLDNAGLLDLVLETRELAQARAPRQIAEPTLPYVTSTALVSAVKPRNFLDRWPQ